jgi:hypothetical protein
MRKYFLLLLLFPSFLFAQGQHEKQKPQLQEEDSLTDSLKVYFLYGSKPKWKFRKSERKWFGGILGGHVGLSLEEDKIIDFLPLGKLHIFPQKKEQHAHFVWHSERSFWAVLGGNPDSVKKVILYIPITAEQQRQFDSIAQTYFEETPYDYAFFGMRCGASTYEILAQLGILRAYSNRRTVRKIFYPKKLRRRLFRLEKENNWKLEKMEGSKYRRWEQD